MEENGEQKTTKKRARACEAIRQEVKRCIKESECVQVDRRKARECVQVC